MNSPERTANILAALSADPAFRRLPVACDRGNPFRLLGIQYDEVLHSDLLANLLRPNGGHSFGDAFLRAFLEDVAEDVAKTPRPTCTMFNRLLSRKNLNYVKVHRELDRVDIVIEFHNDRAVVGVENKILAGERERQVSDYQAAIERRYTGWDACIVFLTPHGRESATSSSNTRVSCLPRSYSLVATVARRVAETSRVSPAEATFLGQLAEHIEEDIMDRGAVKQAVRELWQTHGDAAHLLLQHRPALRDIHERFEKEISDRIPDVKFEFYPSKGDLAEIKFIPPKWGAANLNFTVMLDGAFSRGPRPHLRILLWSEHYDANPRHYESFAAHANSQLSGGYQIGEGYPKVRGWSCWRQVLSGASAIEIDDCAYGQHAVDEAVRAFDGWFGVLDPVVQAWKPASDHLRRRR